MKVRHLIKDWSSLSTGSRVLVINGFTFNLGFYMLLPYLADHLQQSLGLSPWHVGLVIGLRVLSQQGLFLVGGTLGDYLGYKRLILLGCLVRVAGFLALGVATSLPMILLGAFLTGFAGALFTPSSNAYLAHEAPNQRARDRIFSMQNWTSEAGMFLGPLLGVALFSISFAWVGTLAAGLFLLLFVTQWRYLPDLSEQEKRTGKKSLFWQQWLSMFANRSFMLFVAFACGFHLFFHQLYLALPYQVRVSGQGAEVITWVFMTSSVLAISMQLPISRWIEKNIGSAQAMRAGMILMGVSFLFFLLESELLAWGRFILFAICFSLGSMILLPLLGSHVAKFCCKAELGSYYGLYSCVGGLAAFFGNSGVGWLLSLDSLNSQWIWCGFAIIGLFTGQGLYRQVVKLS
ncbi:MFS transporter [Marinomonas epiphytica]